MGGYTRAFYGQRLGKHVPIARQHILNNATVGVQQWRSCVFYVVRAENLQARDNVSLVSSIWESVKGGLEPEAEE
jgi:hypothetical protein